MDKYDGFIKTNLPMRSCDYGGCTRPAHWYRLYRDEAKKITVFQRRCNKHVPFYPIPDD